MAANTCRILKDGEFKTQPNMILSYTKAIFKSEFARLDGQLAEDFTSVMQGQCVYLQHAICELDDFSLLKSLMDEMAKNEESSDESGMINWSKHYKYENPDFSSTFQYILQLLSDYFDVDIHATRLNFYPDASSWKPFHHDSHAYGEKGVKEDFTMGVSLGAARELIFLHPPSTQSFAFPQRNGDVFAFDSDVNKRFQHGVPKVNNANVGPRFSVIAWGRRRHITERNGGKPGEVTPNPMQTRNKDDDEFDQYAAKVSVQNSVAYAGDIKQTTNTKGPDMRTVVAQVDSFINQHKAQAEQTQALNAGRGLGRGGMTVKVAAAGGRGGRVQGGAFRQTNVARPVFPGGVNANATSNNDEDTPSQRSGSVWSGRGGATTNTRGGYSRGGGSSRGGFGTQQQ